MLRCKTVAFFLVVLFFSTHTYAQIVRIDSVAVPKPISTFSDTSDYYTKHHRDPHKATVRSAIIPGWGQWYNHKYWKVPIVVGALVTTGIIFNYWLGEYKMYRQAYLAVIDASNGDSTLYRKIDTAFYTWSPPDIQYARNESRQYVDYSALAFVLIWGLNVVDATVDAHLHEFDVTDNLSMNLSPSGGWLTGGALGVSLIVDIHKAKHKPYLLLTHPLY